jgi:hypothetical protein
MVDVTLPQADRPSRWRAGPSISPILLKRARGLLLAFLLALGWSAVIVEAAQRRCDSPLGKLMVRLKLDSYYSSCQCMTHSLDFSDACNSMYTVIGL